MSRPSEPWASREAGRHTDVAWGTGTVMRDHGWPDQVFTTHYHGDDSELPMLAAGATTGNAGSGRWVEVVPVPVEVEVAVPA